MGNHIGVLPKHQGRGLGRRLLEEFLQHVEAEVSGSSADLRINVVELNTRAVTWYRRLGFLVVSTKFDAGSGQHVLEDGREIDLSREFARGSAVFEQPLHDFFTLDTGLA